MRFPLFLLVGLLCFVVPVVAQETLYSGKTVTHWKSALRGADANLRLEAAARFQQMTPQDIASSLPELTAALADESHYIRTYVARAIGLSKTAGGPAVPALMQALKDAESNPTYASNASTIIGALGNIGPAAGAAVPLLSAGLEKPDGLASARAMAISNLGDAGKVAVPTLKKLMRSEEHSALLFGGAMTLATFEPDAPELREALIQLAPLNRFIKTVNPPPILASEFLERHPELLITHLVPMLKHEAPKVRWGAARTLAYVGERAKSKASQPLQQALSEPDPEVRAAVVGALAAVDRDGFTPAVPVLIRLLGLNQFDTLQAARLLKPRPEPFFQLLIQEFKETPPEQHEGLIQTLYILQRFDPLGERLPYLTDRKRIEEQNGLLIAGLDNPSPRIQRGVLHTIARAELPLPSIKSKFLQLTNSPDAGVRLDAIHALSKLDPQPFSMTDWLPLLTEVIATDDDALQLRALVHLQNLQGRATSAVPAILKVLRDEQEPKAVRLRTALAIAAIDPLAGKDALPLLLSKLQALPNVTRPSGEATFWEVFRALQKFGPSAGEAGPKLREIMLVANQDPKWSSAALVTLWRVDPSSGEFCRNQLQKMLADKTRDRSEEFADAILLITEWKENSAELIPLVRQRVQEKHIDPQIKVAAALGLILTESDADQTALRYLRDIISEGSEGYARNKLLEILGKLGVTARTFAPELKPLLDDPRHRSKVLAFWQKVGYEPKP